MPKHTITVKSLLANRRVRRWATCGTGGLIAAVAGYAAFGALTGTKAAASPMLASAVAPVASQATRAVASGALMSDPAQATIVSNASGNLVEADPSTVLSDSEDWKSVADALAPTTEPTTAPATMLGSTAFSTPTTPLSYSTPVFVPATPPAPLASPVATATPADTDVSNARTAAVTWQPTTAPAAAAPVVAKNNLVTAGLNEQGRIALAVNRTAEVKTNVPVKRVSVGQPDVADVQPFASNILLVTAKKPGTTQLIVWDDQNHSQSIDVTVEIPLDQLKDLIAKVAPGANIEVSVANAQIVLRGQAPDLAVAKRVSDLASAFGPVQNFIEVAGAQTVAVQVQFAEVSRSVTNSLGVNWGFSDGTTIFGIAPGGSGPFGFHTDDKGFIDTLNSALTPGSNDAFGLTQLGGSTVSVFIKALRDNSLLRVLQEPTLTTTSGEPASFLAGGQVPVPVPADNGNVAIEYKEFGVRLKLTPVVLGNGKIRLVMEAESSDLDYANGTKISGASVPGLRTRRVQNTVELGEGQTISVAGLLDDSVVATRQSVPGLGDIPVLGQLFRSTRYQRKETELVILITPRLSGAMNPDQVPPLPGAGWRHPNELEQFAFGDMGGNKEADATRDWNKAPSKRGLKPGETQKNTNRVLEPASVSQATPSGQPQSAQPLSPPPAFIGDDHWFAPADDGLAGAPRD